MTALPAEATSIIPSYYSADELQWLIDHVGEAPIIARQSVPPLDADGSAGTVNPRSVLPVIERIYDIMELDKVGGLHSLRFVGVDSVREGFQYYLNDVLREQNEPNAKIPKLGNFDRSGQFHKGMVGGDSDVVRSKWVRSRETGRFKKRSYVVELFEGGASQSYIVDFEDDDTAEEVAQPDVGDFVIEFDTELEIGTIRNPVDGHTEEFKTGVGTKMSETAAWDRMRDHCRSQKTDADAHRVLLMSIDAQRGGDGE